MPSQFIHFFIVYGYLAIFLTVFFQEIGIPTIIPNEISLFFFGYLSHQGSLNLAMVLGIAIISEMSGTLLIYFLFRVCGSFLLRHKPKWMPIPFSTIRKFKTKIINKGNGAIFIGRMTPFVRGYISVIAGLIRTPFRQFTGVAFLAAICSTGGCIMGGWILAPYWQILSTYFKAAGNVFLFLLASLVTLFFIIFLVKRRSPERPVFPTLTDSPKL